MDHLTNLKNILKNTEDLYMHFKIDEIVKDHKLVNDLGIDSLGRITIFYELTHAINIEGDELVAHRWEKVADIIQYMKDNTNA